MVLHFFFGCRVVGKIHIYSEIPSTNQIAFKLAAAGALHGEIVCARSQTAGRGRLGKAWTSPSGKGLYFSIIVRPQLKREDYPKLTMTAGLAVASALEDIADLPVLLKWPNDIILSVRKCGGILCEASLGGERYEERFAVIGIGLNVLTQPSDFPLELQSSATSLLIETGKSFDLEILQHGLAEQVLNYTEMLVSTGFNDVLIEWKKRDFLKGKWLKWLTHDDRVIVAKSEGPDDTGRLLVRDRHDKLHQVLSGDVTLAGNWQKKGADHPENDSSLE